MTHQEAEIFQLMARGRAARSRAFIEAFAWMARGVKRFFVYDTPVEKTAGAQNC